MTASKKPKDLIKKYSTALVAGMSSKISASSSLNHKLTKGELRELFISNVLSAFLTKQFDIGTGIIINHKGEQSNQTDIIIYDNRILPPFIKEQHIGVYPVECVVGTIEVKSRLDKESIINSEQSAKLLYDKIYDPNSSKYPELMPAKTRPITAAIGFYGIGAKELKNQEQGKDWLNEHVKHMQLLCLIKKFCWVKLQPVGWKKSARNNDFEETKEFIAVFLDSLRTKSEMRLDVLEQYSHKDWLSIYIREQG